MNPPILQLTDADRERLEQFLVEFDQHWTPHHLAIVAGQLQSEAPDYQAAALVELAKIDLDYRHQQKPTRVEWYLERIPELGESPTSLSELLQAEIFIRQAAGDSPTAEELQQRFPSLHEQIEALLAKVAAQDEFSAIQRAKRADSHAEVSDSTKSIAASARNAAAESTTSRHAARRQRRAAPAVRSLSPAT